MELSLRLNPTPDAVWDLANQCGIETGVFNLPTPRDGSPPWAYEPLREMQQRANDRGLEVAVIEERPPMDAIRCDTAGRETQLESVRTLIKNMGRLDIPIWCWSWRTHFPVIRTGRVTMRGGSEGTAFNLAHLPGHLAQNPIRNGAPHVTEDQLWERVEGFLEEVIPVAEEAGVKLAIHPDDPPIDGPIEETARIMTDPDAFERLIELYPSPNNGICFGQGNFAAMGVDIPETIERFGDSIHFVHFRDVVGTAENFYESWHDNGQTDMLAAMEAYREIGFDGPIRPDHYPRVTAGDGEGTLKGRLHAIGYMQGLLEATS